MTMRCCTGPGTRRGEGGFILIMGLIMLVLLTLVAVSAFRIGANETAIAGNAQHRNEAVNAAQVTIDTVIHSSDFTKNPAAAIASGNCSDGGANALCVDSNGDGTSDFTVTLTPQPVCIVAAPIPASKLDFANNDDLACASEVQQAHGVAGAVPTGNSLCANSTWEVSAQAADATTGTSLTVVQGVAVRIATTDMASNCP